MNEITITSQLEWDSLPDSFDEHTNINIRIPGDIWLLIRRIPKNSSAVLRGNSSAELWGSSSAELWGSSSAVLRENSSAVLWENSISRVFSSDSSIKTGHSSVVICQDCTPKIDGEGIVVRTKKFLHNINSFVDMYPAVNGRVTLYKSVHPDTHCDFRTGKIKYKGRVVCPDFDPDTTRQCGGGLHLSPRPYLARQYNDGCILECSVPLKYTDYEGVEHDNIIVYGSDISKVRCREVEVLGVWDKERYRP